MLRGWWDMAEGFGRVKTLPYNGWDLLRVWVGRGGWVREGQDPPLQWVDLLCIWVRCGGWVRDVASVIPYKSFG